MKGVGTVGLRVQGNMERPLSALDLGSLEAYDLTADTAHV